MYIPHCQHKLISLLTLNSITILLIFVKYLIIKKKNYYYLKLSTFELFLYFSLS